MAGMIFFNNLVYGLTLTKPDNSVVCMWIDSNRQIRVAAGNGAETDEEYDFDVEGTVIGPAEADAPDKLTGTVPASAIANAVSNHTVNLLFLDTQLKAHLDALGTKINAALAAMRSTGLITT